MEPTFEQLVAWVSGELDGAQAKEIEAALSRTPRLGAVVDRLRDVLRTLQTDDTEAPTPEAIGRALALIAELPKSERAPTWLEHAARVVAEIVFDTRATPTLAGMRGGESGYQLGLESRLGRLDLQVLPTGRGDRRNVRVRGHIEAATGSPCGLVTMTRPGTPSAVVVSTIPDEHGRFRMDLPAGTYDLMIAFEEESAALIASDLQIS